MKNLKTFNEFLLENEDSGLPKSVHSALGPKQDRIIISGKDVKKHSDEIIKIVKKHDAGSNIQYYPATDKCVGIVIMSKIDGIRRDLKRIDPELVAELKSQMKK